MADSGNKTSSYRLIKNEFGNIYQFFCDVSGALVWQTSAYNESNPEKELMLAWQTEGKSHFNMCHKCGKWVMDAMYNPDVLNCVMCSPIEDIPNFCPSCGAEANSSDTFCHKCGARLMYGGLGNEG